MGKDAATLSRAVFDDVWNREDHAVLLRAIPCDFVIDDGPVTIPPGGPLLALNLLNLHKAYAPDLTFEVKAQTVEKRRVITDWEATGHHSGVVWDTPPTSRRIKLRGRLVAATSREGEVTCWRGIWDIDSFIRQVGITGPQFMRLLNPGRDDIVLRAIVRKRGVPVLLFPTLGLPGWHTWRRFIDVLAPKRPVVTFQLLGNRWAFEHRRVPAAYSVKAETSALKCALERSELHGPFDIVGHSAGGTLALDFALDYKEAVRSLTLIEPGPTWVVKATGRLDEEMKADIRDRLAVYSGRLTNAGYGAFLKRAFLEKGHEPTKSAHWPLVCSYKGNMKFRPALYTHMDDPQRLRAVQFPVMLVQASHSDRLHREIGRVLRSKLPDVRVVRMPGGHFPHYYPEGAALLLKHLSRFHRSCRQTALTRNAPAAHLRAAPTS